MANVLTDLAADIYKAADVIGREQVGLIPSVTVNGDATTTAAKGDTIRSHFTRTPSVSTSYSPSMTIPEGTDQTVDNKTMSLDTYANVQIPWTGEDMKHLDNGSGFETIYGDQIMQAMRAIVNSIEIAGCLAAYKAASRAFGTAGTTPFGSNFNEVAELRQILADNGCPMQDGQLSLVINSLAGTNLRQLAQLQKVNESGDTSMLRQGELLNLQGFRLRESAGIASHTKGTGASYVSNAGTTEPVGETSIAVDTGSGTILAGDVVTFENDSANKYVVNTALSGGVFVVGDPGVRVAVGDGDTVTVGNSYTANLGLHRSAVELGIRPLAEPRGGDAAVDRMTVQDPRSGLVFTISAYKGYKKAMFEIGCLYGWKAWKSQHIALLLG